GQSRSANGRKRTTKCHTPALGRGAEPDIGNAPARPGYAPAGRPVACYGGVVGVVTVGSAPCFLTSCGWRVWNPATFMATSFYPHCATTKRKGRRLFWMPAGLTRM